MARPKPRLKVGVLISGRGSNLQALIDAAADPAYPAEIVLVISNRPEAAGMLRAQSAGIAHRAIAHPGRELFAMEADSLLRQSGAELVALAGFMRILDTAFVEAWRDRLVNIHPSLLPAFPGLHPQRQALAAGVRFSGCTVHFVRAEVDTGEGPGFGQTVFDLRGRYQGFPEQVGAHTRVVLECDTSFAGPVVELLVAAGESRIAGAHA
jgi:phosphoribosylglycinamide formyltransferase-1